MESRVPARVIGVLSRDTVTVLLAPDQGLADGGVPTELPIDMVPPELRFPNRSFILVMDGPQAVRVEAS